jgi:hypothetical protein
LKTNAVDAALAVTVSEQVVQPSAPPMMSAAVVPPNVT